MRACVRCVRACLEVPVREKENTAGNIRDLQHPRLPVAMATLTAGKGSSNGPHIQINLYYMKLRLSVSGSNLSPPW